MIKWIIKKEEIHRRFYIHDKLSNRISFYLNEYYLTGFMFHHTHIYNVFFFFLPSFVVVLHRCFKSYNVLFVIHYNFQPFTLFRKKEQLQFLQIRCVMGESTKKKLYVNIHFKPIYTHSQYITYTRRVDYIARNISPLQYDSCLVVPFCLYIKCSF